VLKVLFICSGNICRSPTAEGVFRHHVAQVGWQNHVAVASAGTLDYHVGDRPDRRSIAAAQARGYDLSALRARHLSERDFVAFDQLLAMDRGHLSILMQRSPSEHRHKIRLFMDYAPHLPHREVPDPYYGDSAGFELVLDLVEAASRGLLEDIRPRVGAEPPGTQRDRE
jgi:protein-tyrosine phosphatase